MIRYPSRATTTTGDATDDATGDATDDDAGDDGDADGDDAGDDGDANRKPRNHNMSPPTNRGNLRHPARKTLAETVLIYGDFIRNEGGNRSPPLPLRWQPESRVFNKAAGIDSAVNATIATPATAGVQSL